MVHSDIAVNNFLFIMCSDMVENWRFWVDLMNACVHGEQENIFKYYWESDRIQLRIMYMILANTHKSW